MLAQDSTARWFDTDGRMHIDRSHITKAGVCPYRGDEIPGWKALGLDPKRVYRLLLPPDELKKGASTFERIQLISKHVPVDLYDSMDADVKKALIVGTVGSDVEYNHPYLDADLCYWDAAAIAGVETNILRELSGSFYYIPVMTSGTYEGESYDGIMTQIRGNHLATVEAGRRGPDVLAADSALKREPLMKMTKKGKALFVTLTTAFPKLAQDASLPGLMSELTSANYKRDELRPKLLAMDAAMPPASLDLVMDAVMDDDEPEPKEKKPVAKDADDETEEEKKAREKKEADEKADKTAADADEKVKTAMDAAIKTVTTDLREADQARRDVRTVVGDVAMDSAADIYGFALDHLKVERTGVTGTPALRALFKAVKERSASPAPVVAMDSAPLITKFPGLARFQ